LFAVLKPRGRKKRRKKQKAKRGGNPREKGKRDEIASHQQVGAPSIGSPGKVKKAAVLVLERQKKEA